MEDLGKPLEQAVASSLLQWKDAEGHFAAAKNCLLKHAKKIDVREKQLLEMKERIEGRNREVEMKCERVDECRNDISVKGEELKVLKALSVKCDLELGSKRKELSLVQGDVMKSREKLLLVKGQLALVQKDLQDCHKEISVRKQQLGMVEKSVTEVSGELQFKEKELSSAKILLEERCKEIQVKESKLELIRKSMEENSAKLSAEESNLASAKKSLRECCEELASKESRLEAIQATYGELGKNPIEKEKCFESLEKTIEERLEYDGSKEQQLLAMQKSLEEKCKEAAVEEHCGSFIVSSQLKDVQSEDSPVNSAIGFLHSDSMSSDHNFQSQLNKYGTETDLGSDEVLASLYLSTDPASLVLNMLRGSCKNEVIGLTAGGMRRNVRLLENLMKVSPKITPQVKEQARELALVWEPTTELEMQNSDDVLAFLLLVGVYELATRFSEQELLRFAEVVIQQKQAPKICRALGFASMIPDFIKKLIAKKEYLAAARFSCEFGLGDKFAPIQLLKDYLGKTIMDALVSESSRESCEAKCKVIDTKIAALRSILECISDCKLNCSSLVLKFTNQIFELGKQKERCSLQTSNPADESPQDSKIYQSLSTRGRSIQKKRMNSRDELRGENGNKLRRVDIASDR